MNSHECAIVIGCPKPQAVCDLVKVSWLKCGNVAVASGRPVVQMICSRFPPTIPVRKMGSRRLSTAGLYYYQGSGVEREPRSPACRHRLQKGPGCPTEGRWNKQGKAKRKIRQAGMECMMQLQASWLQMGTSSFGGDLEMLKN